MPSVGGQVGWLDECVRAVMQNIEAVNEFDQLFEIGQTSLPPPTLEIGAVRLPADRREDNIVAADDDRALWIASVKGERGWGFGDGFYEETPVRPDTARIRVYLRTSFGKQVERLGI